ncbi:MAG: hypothetical protein ACRDF0_09415 [Candidatus Limnocylindria bacterium]
MAPSVLEIRVCLDPNRDCVGSVAPRQSEEQRIADAVNYDEDTVRGFVSGGHPNEAIVREAGDARSDCFVANRLQLGG